MTHQPLWVILCHLPEKGRRGIEQIVEEMKERDMGERKMNESEGTKEMIKKSVNKQCLLDISRTSNG